ncbi:hypothetical protein [Fructobacillus parabroussonetiae]|nr:hypothetical protein [Fructobacillus parabroussonetiae]
MLKKKKLAKNIINQKQVKRFDEDQDQITFSGDDLSVIWPTYLL